MTTQALFLLDLETVSKIWLEAPLLCLVLRTRTLLSIYPLPSTWTPDEKYTMALSVERALDINQYGGAEVVGCDRPCFGQAVGRCIYWSVRPNGVAEDSLFCYVTY